MNAPGFAPDVVDALAGQALASPPPRSRRARSAGNRFEADLSTRGAGVTHFYLTDARYALSDAKDVSTTPDIERWRNLRTLFRTPGVAPATDDQVKYDRFNWKLDRRVRAGLPIHVRGRRRAHRQDRDAANRARSS